MRKQYEKLSLLFRKAEINGMPVLYPWPAVSIAYYKRGKFFSSILHLRLSWLRWELVLVGETLR